MTATLSVDAVHESETVVPVVADADNPVGRDGAVVSGGGHVAVDVISVSDGDWLPAAS